MRYFYKETENGISFVVSTIQPEDYTEVSEYEYKQLYQQSLQKEPHLLTRLSRAKSAFRQYRGEAFKAFDIYKTNIEYGVVTETASQHEAIVEWYDDMLNFPELITPESIEELKFPAIPEAIVQYVQGGVTYEPFTD